MAPNSIAILPLLDWCKLELLPHELSIAELHELPTSSVKSRRVVQLPRGRKGDAAVGSGCHFNRLVSEVEVRFSCII